MLAAACGHLHEGAPDILESAVGLHAAGELSLAEVCYHRIIDANPQHREAQHYLGVLMHQRGHSQEGVSLIRYALAADGGSASRFNDLGNILVQSGDRVGAIAAFRASIELNGDDANTWNNLGAVLHQQQLTAEAEAAFRAALHCDDEFEAALNNLAALLLETGREEESSLFACRAFVLPPRAGKPPKMLGIAYYRLGRIVDAAACYRAWLEAEPGNEVARQLLAACTGDAVPARASDGFVKSVFDDMAGTFDEKLLGKLSYRGPQIIGGLLEGTVAADRSLDVLDAGCGTGLCAPVLAPYARRLTGVDLSPGMLARARAGERYDELAEAELTGYLHTHHQAFDLVVMADTLIYFGDLAAVFGAAAQALRGGGTFVFTVEANTQPAPAPKDIQLNPSGRYSHSRRYLLQVLDAAGFTLLRNEEVELRSEFGLPARGLGIVARKRA